MKYATFDVETTTSHKGNPFDQTNRLVCFGIRYGGSPNPYISFDLQPENILPVNRTFGSDDFFIIGFNLKFDLNWWRKIGGQYPKHIWDCQIAEFLLSNQEHKYPSLDDALLKYGFPPKLDVVKTEYWERKCSCHVSIVERIKNYIANNYALRAITENMKKGIESPEMLRNVCGENLIQNAIKQLKTGEITNYLMILKQRQEHIEHITNENTPYVTMNMIDSWLKTLAQFVEAKGDSISTITISQEKLEIDCVHLVTQLWHTWNERIGWNEHHPTCKNTPVDTDEIPRHILTEYLEGDLEKTEKVFKQQYRLFHSEKYKHLYPLFKLQCQDLLVLADMEYNGVYFNTEKALEHAHKIQTRQNEITEGIHEFVGNVPFSLTSDAHLSALLYGGIILEEFRIPVGVYKSGEKAGQPRYNIAYKTYEFPQLIKPLKGSQVKEKVSQKELEFIKKKILKEPRVQYSVNEDTLKQLKPSKQGRILLDLIMEFNKLDKLRSTYLEGWPKLIKEMNWEKDMLHSQLNQCLVITGRLSSSKPNGQNADKMTKLFCESRYV